jgi:hypothetical protein
MLGIKRKNADDQIDYDIDFSRWLSDGDSVVSAEGQADKGIELLSVAVFGSVVKVWVAGGTAGQTYTVTITATSAESRVIEQCFKIRVTGC